MAGGLLGILIDRDMGAFHAVDEHANAQAGGKKCAEQEEVVCGLSPGYKKQKRDHHQQFGVHGVFLHLPFGNTDILSCISAFFFIP